MKKCGKIQIQNPLGNNSIRVLILIWFRDDSTRYEIIGVIGIKSG